MNVDPKVKPEWVPNVDVFTTQAGDLIIKVELAEMQREDLELTLEGDRIVISGYRPDSEEGSKCKYLCVEIPRGQFEVRITIPASFDASRAYAAYKNGMLRVIVPRLTKERPTSRPAS